jgi:hypothetical protein
MSRQHFLGVQMGLLVGIGCSTRVDDPMNDVADDVTDGSGSTDGSPELDPPDGLPIVIEPTPTYGPVQGAWPAVAFDGTQYLAVWEDHRLRRPILYGGRVTADGTALDPYGFRILDAVPDTEHTYAYRHAVAFDGETFLVATAADGRVFGVRVSPAGEVLDPDGFLIASTQMPSAPSMVFDGEQYLVAWRQSEPGSSGIFQARVEPDATVLDPGGVLIYETHAEEHGTAGVSMSFDGTHSLLTWETNGGALLEPRLLHAGRTAVDGTLIDQSPVRLSPEDEYVQVHAAGFDGTNHVIAWYSFEGGIRATRVTPEGTVLDPDGFVVDDIAYRASNRLDMAAGNGRSILVWSGFPTEIPFSPAPVRAAQIATDGTTSSLPDDAFPPGREATIAAQSNGALMLWRDGLEPTWDDATIVGTRLDATGIPVGNAMSPTSPASRQDVKAVASDGQNFFVLWTDSRGPTGDRRALHGARVGADGTPLDAESLQLTTEPVYWADVVFDGANFVVTWLDPECWGSDCGDAPPSSNTVRVSPDGERLDAPPLQLPLCGEMAGASDGTYTLLAGHECFADDVALLLDQNGVVASALVPVPIVNGGAASFDGSSYLVAWFNFQNQLFGHRITQAGTPDGQPFMIDDAGVHHVGIAAGGGKHLVVWDTDSEIRATRVSSNGQVLDPEGLLVATLENSACDIETDRNTCSESSVVFDGERFVVAWRELSIPGHASSLDLYAARVSLQGEVSPRFVISQAPEREGAPFLAANGEGQVLAAYNQFIPGPPYDTRRAVAKLLP